MANTSNTYEGDGSTNSWTVGFNYLNKPHVKLYIDGVEDVTYTWITDSTIAATVVPVDGAEVLIQRETPRNALVTSIAASGTLRGNDVNRIGLQALYVAEEGYDALLAVLQEDLSDGKFDAELKVIKNLGAPVNPNDAVRKVDLDTIAGSETGAAESAAAALASELAAAISAAAALVSENNAETAETNAEAAAALTAADVISSAANASSASSSASTATTQAGIATTQAGLAATSASNASSSASSASTSASTATSQATIATTQAGLAATAKTAAELAETNAETAEVAAEAAQVAAEAARDAALTAETNAETAETNAETAATTATTQAGIATTQAGNAATSASTATTQAGIATTQAGLAATAKTAAELAETNAEAAEVAAEAAQSAAEAAKVAAEAAQAGAELAEDNTAAALVGYLTISGAAAAYQPLATELGVWAGVVSTANGRSLVSAADYAAMRALLDLEAGTDFYSKTAADAAFAPISHTHTASQISDATANGRSLITSANYASMRALLDLEAGTDFLSPAAIAASYQPLDADLSAWAGVNPSSYSTTAQIAAAYQPLDADLTAIAGLTSAADRVPYYTGSGSAALATFTTFGRSLVDDADASTARTTLGMSSNGSSLVSSATYATMRGLLDLEAGTDFYSIAGADAAFAPLSHTHTVSQLSDATANGRSLISSANYASMRGLLDLEAGTDFYSIAAANAAFAPLSHTHTVSQLSDATANGRSLISSANYASMRGLLDLEAGTDFYSIAAADAKFATKTRFNIEDYGAVGDGSTNNTTAIQNCLNAAIAYTGDFASAVGAVVYIPPGRFVTGPLFLDCSTSTTAYAPRVSIEGDGPAASILQMVSGNTGAILSITGGDYSTGGSPDANNQQYNHSFFRNFGLRGNYNTTGTSETGLFIQKMVYCTIEDMLMVNFGGYGYNFIDLDQSTFRRVVSTANLRGATISNGTPSVTGANSIVFDDCHWTNNTDYGFEFFGCQACTFTGGSIQYNGQTRGSSSYFGCLFAENNGKGYGTVNFIGTIFEGNRGKADVWLDIDANAGVTDDFNTFNFIGCAWYRAIINSIVFGSTNGILMDGDSPNLRVTLKGNIFFDGGGYDDNVAYPWVSNTNTAAKLYADGSNYFRANEAAGTTAEKPIWGDYLHLPALSGISFDWGDFAIRHATNTLIAEGGLWQFAPGQNATQASQSTYPVQIVNGSEALTMGFDGTSNVIQSWNGKNLSLNPQGNDVILAGYGVLGAWDTHSPTPTPQTGAYSNVTCVGAYKRIGKTVTWRGYLVFTAINTGAGYCQVATPGGATFKGNHTFTAIEWNSGGDVKSIFGADGTAYIRFYTPPGFGTGHANGDAIPFCITFEVN